MAIPDPRNVPYMGFDAAMLQPDPIADELGRQREATYHRLKAAMMMGQVPYPNVVRENPNPPMKDITPIATVRRV